MDDTDIKAVLARLPHRYPFLLIDRVLEYTPGESLKALKNVTFNEPFFQGHFPRHPVMPGVLILEALAQATGLLAVYTTGDPGSENRVFYFVSIDNVRFKHPVFPGDQLILEVVLKRYSRGFGKFDCTASVEGRSVASGELMCMEKDIEE